MKDYYRSILFFGTILVVGCGGGGSSDDESTTVTTDGKILNSIHKYHIVANPTSGGSCRGAEGEMIIEEHTISGSIKTGWGDTLMIEGTYDMQSGQVDGGFAKNNSRLASYDGVIANNQGEGAWSDNLGCSGSWKGSGYASNYIDSTASTSSTEDSISSTKGFDPNSLEGYEIRYEGSGLVSYTIIFGCDGTFETRASRHEVTVETTYGDTIIVDGDTLVLESSVNSMDNMRISLVGGNIVLGESVDDMGNVITDMEQIESCN